MSWVMSTTDEPVSRRSVRIRSRICAWIVTSSAVVGSSAISTRGRHDSAIAIITRWRMPPEKWCGKSSTRCSASAIPTARSSSTARSRAAAADSPSCSRTCSAICQPTR